MAFTILSSQNLTASSANVSVNDTPSGTFTASKLTVADTSPAITGGQATISEGANTETKRIISVLNGTEFVVEHLTNSYTTAALVTFFGFTNPGDPLGQTTVQGASGLKLNGSRNKAESFWNVYAKDLKILWQKIGGFLGDGKLNSSDLELKTDAISAGDRSVKFHLTASTWVRLLWDNATGLFKLVDESGNLKKLLVADSVVTGEIKPYAGSSAPSGYLLCDGSAVSRTTYADLFTVIGTTYGSGDGSTTFNVPDLRGRVPLGKDNMGGTAANRITSASTGGSNATTLGGTGGAQTHTLAQSEMPAHTHSYNVSSATQSVGSGGSSNLASTTSSTTGSTGSGDPHSNTQPWIALNYIVKT